MVAPGTACDKRIAAIFFDVLHQIFYRRRTHQRGSPQTMCHTNRLSEAASECKVAAFDDDHSDDPSCSIAGVHISLGNVKSEEGPHYVEANVVL